MLVLHVTTQTLALSANLHTYYLITNAYRTVLLNMLKFNQFVLPAHKIALLV